MLSFCLIFCQFQPGVAYKSVSCKKARKFVLGETVQLKVRFIYQCIETMVSWENKFNISIYNNLVEEILFRKFSLRKLNITSAAQVTQA